MGVAPKGTVHGTGMGTGMCVSAPWVMPRQVLYSQLSEGVVLRDAGVEAGNSSGGDWAWVLERK